MRVLYKYLPPPLPSDSDPVPLVIRTQTFVASDPRTFNDPFEVRPYFDQERHDCFAAGHEGFHGAISGAKHSLVAGASIVGVPVENVVGFGDSLNQRFREAIGKRFRVVCLSANPKSTLMWGHYTHTYRGAVIGVDVDDAAFRTGLRPPKVSRSPIRRTVRLPNCRWRSTSSRRLKSITLLGKSPTHRWRRLSAAESRFSSISTSNSLRKHTFAP